MNRRDILAALPATLIAGSALAQPPVGAPSIANQAGRGPGGPGAPGGAGAAGRGGAGRAPTPPLADPALPMKILATGLNFNEGPVHMNNGDIVFVEIGKQTITRLKPDGKLETVVDVPGGPNGLAIGPDKALYIANNGKRFNFTVSNGENNPGAMPADHKPGTIMRYDFATKQLETLFSTVDGKPMGACDDLIFDHTGGLYVTDLGAGQTPSGIYYAAKGARELTLVHAGNGPNGIGISPDGKMLHFSGGTSLYTYDILSPGKIGTEAKRTDALVLNAGADSLKVLASGKVAVCSNNRPGGIGVHDLKGHIQFFGFPDRYTANLVFGGKDMRDCWLMLSGTGKIAKVRWPEPGLRAAYYA